jgi:hypothetical protein
VEGDFEDRIRHGFTLVLSRPPSDHEIEELAGLHADLRAGFEQDIPGAKQFATEPMGEPPFEFDPANLAAWTGVASVLLNLDETLMKR